MSKIYLATEDWVLEQIDNSMSLGDTPSVFSEIKSLGVTEDMLFPDSKTHLSFDDDNKSAEIFASSTTVGGILANAYIACYLGKISFASYLKMGYTKLNVSLLRKFGPTENQSAQFVISTQPSRSSGVVYSVSDLPGNTAQNCQIDISKLTGEYYIGLWADFKPHMNTSSSYLYYGGLSASGWFLEK